MGKESDLLTLCEILRLVYRRTEDQEVRKLLRVAVTIGKRLTQELLTQKRFKEEVNTRAWLCEFYDKRDL